MLVTDLYDGYTHYLQNYLRYHWKQKAVNPITPPSLMAQQIVVMKIRGATSDDDVVIPPIPCLEGSNMQYKI